ncbi:MULTISPECIES: Hpt domain-containing protein [Arthrobacter]|uniref:Hpt domain-containing protein n=1 Tax=Arthrobacter oryzae TaxID=409290 RepID=A0A3N0C042_9MICC|nr:MULTISPECIES: Hpt domain-containing protein [Arthrobacter]QYF90466.1 Hpt domain-containing protein [Arthrobacter sp. PAMC25284]RNL55640.1 Hpt domain-containing protein [Arthrobacter oryzae]
MAGRPGETVLDAAVLIDLADQMQSDALARKFALKFVDLLQPRHDRILATLGKGDIRAALDAVLSLKVNARMVGAFVVEQTCQALQRCVLDGDNPAAARYAQELPRDIDDVKDAIAELLTGALHRGTPVRDSVHPMPPRGGSGAYTRQAVTPAL